MLNWQFDFEFENVNKFEDKIIVICVENWYNYYLEIIKGKFFFDCIYEGDLMVVVGVFFMLGCEGGDVYYEVGLGRLYK